jgi:hypothetical protein
MSLLDISVDCVFELNLEKALSKLMKDYPPPASK